MEGYQEDEIAVMMNVTFVSPTEVDTPTAKIVLISALRISRRELLPPRNPTGERKECYHLMDCKEKRKQKKDGYLIETDVNAPTRRWLRQQIVVAGPMTIT